MFLKYPPSVIIKKKDDGTFAYDGISIDILKYFTSAYNITYCTQFNISL